MQSIDVHDLPAPLAAALAETVRVLREQFNKNGNAIIPRLPVWQLGAVGTLSREEIYGDQLDRKFAPGGA